MFEIIDLIQRKINSFIFRSIILLYTTIILITHENIFPSHIYIIGSILYIILYFVFLKRQRHRLFNDFMFFSLIILGKNPNEPFVFILLILPIVNSINFSGNKKSPILYIITAATYLSLLCYFNQKIELIVFKNSILPISSFIFLWIIEAYTSLRLKIRDFRDRLNEVVDGFYTNKELIKKPHKVYSEIINTINSRIKEDLIKDLYCFTINPANGNNLVVINGSSFIWRYKIDEKDFLKKFDKKPYQLNIDLSIDNVKHSHNLVIKTEIEEVVYIYVLTTTKTIPVYYIIIGFFRTLFPSFYKMSKILLMEKKLQDIRNEELQRFSLRSQYITRATKTMHFIRNRLGPVNNLLKMLDNRGKISSNMIAEFDGLIESEKERAKNELESIVSRANYLLEKSNNPFNFIATKAITIEKLFSILRRILSIYFPEKIIEIQLPDTMKLAYVKVNFEGFELFLSDWLHNIKKYYNGYLMVNFVVTDTSVDLIFINDYHVDKHIVEQLILDLMSDDRNEIMKRTTHGLFQIKSSLEEMAIDYLVEKVGEGNELLKFMINLKILNQ